VSPIKRCLLRPHTDEQADKMLRDAWMAGLVKLHCGNWATHERQQWAVRSPCPMLDMVALIKRSQSLWVQIRTALKA
jgi:hypothetical protein